MFDRHLLGDVAIAVLLALPTAALSRPEPPATTSGQSTEIVQQAAHVDQLSTERRFEIDS
jgi:hypothetical protein